MRVQWAAPLLAALTLVATPAPASAQEAGTLKKILDTGVIEVGHRESSIPFAYYDNQQNLIGYSTDFAWKIVDAIRQKLGVPDLRVRLVPITPQNRIPLVQNGTVDFECGSTTNNLERQQQVAFSDTIFVIGTRLMTKRDSGIHDWSDLRGKTVVTTAGTTSERLLRKMNQDRAMGMNVISAKDHGESFAMLSSGRAVAFMMDDALLAGERAKSNNPNQYVIVGAPQSREAYGCMMRKNDAEFKKVVDDAIAKVETSGEADRIYRKWFQSPIPPNGLDLDFPENDDVKAVFRHPNDRPID